GDGSRYSGAAAQVYIAEQRVYFTGPIDLRNNSATFLASFSLTLLVRSGAVCRDEQLSRPGSTNSFKHPLRRVRPTEDQEQYRCIDVCLLIHCSVSRSLLLHTRCTYALSASILRITYGGCNSGRPDNHASFAWPSGKCATRLSRGTIERPD